MCKFSIWSKIRLCSGQWVEQFGNDLSNKISALKNFAGTNLLQLETKTRFLTVEYCTVFQAVFTSTVIANGTQTVEYNATVVTEHNPDADFNLEFRVDVTPGETAGEATAVWRHTHQCLQKYMVRVDKPDGT